MQFDLLDSLGPEFAIDIPEILHELRSGYACSASRALLGQCDMLQDHDHDDGWV